MGFNPVLTGRACPCGGSDLMRGRKDLRAGNEFLLCLADLEKGNIDSGIMYLGKMTVS